MKKLKKSTGFKGRKTPEEIALENRKLDLLEKGLVKKIPKCYKYDPAFCEMLIDHMSKGFSFESFAAIAKTHRDTIFEWVKKFPEFAEAKKEAMELNRFFWERAGMKGMLDSKNFNASVWVFSMKNRFKWSDRSEVEQNISMRPTVIEKLDDTKLELTYKDDKDEE